MISLILDLCKAIGIMIIGVFFAGLIWLIMAILVHCFKIYKFPGGKV